VSLRQPHHPVEPGLRLLGTSASVPSPLHLQLHIITRLSFNEQGRITHHRDFWDMKDMLGLIPGLSLAQWISSRLVARSLGFVAQMLNGRSTAEQVSAFASEFISRAASGSGSSAWPNGTPQSSDLERVAHGTHTKNTLGLQGLSSTSRLLGQ
jgi:hypothetical protein